MILKLPESMAVVTLEHLASEIHLIQPLDTDSISNDNSDTSIIMLKFLKFVNDIGLLSTNKSVFVLY